MVAAAPHRISFPASQPHLGGVLCDAFEGLLGEVFRRSCGATDLVWSGLAGKTTAPSRPCPFVLRVRRHRGGELRLRSWTCELVQEPSVAVLALVWMQVRALPAGVADLTAGRNRGVSPADVLPFVFGSWCSRQAAYAATPTRRVPLQVLTGDPAAACESFGVVSIGTARPLCAAADWACFRGGRGPSCNSSFFQGLLCKVVTASQILDVSCTVFLA